LPKLHLQERVLVGVSHKIGAHKPPDASGYHPILIVTVSKLLDALILLLLFALPLLCAPMPLLLVSIQWPRLPMSLGPLIAMTRPSSILPIWTNAGALPLPLLLLILLPLLLPQHTTAKPHAPTALTAILPLESA